MEIIFYILLAVFILLLMVLVHELGHYTAGKIFKFKIDEFSVGFGPKITQRKNKSGELISIRAVPLGGYCAFEGEESEDACIEVVKGNEITGKASGFNSKPPWMRIIVLFAGPLFNILSAIIFAFIYILAIGYALPVVSNVYADDSGVYNDFCMGDVVIAIDGVDIGVMNSYAELVSEFTDGETAVFEIIRDGETMFVDAEVKNINLDDKSYFGFGFSTTYDIINYNIGDAFVNAVPYTFKLSVSILSSFGDILTGDIALTELSGPIGTINSIAEYSALDMRYVLLFLPLLASNLAIFNLLPIPALDGMRIIFTFIEWVRGKPVNRKVENAINFFGLVALFGFVIVIDLLSFIL